MVAEVNQIDAQTQAEAVLSAQHDPGPLPARSVNKPLVEDKLELQMFEEQADYRANAEAVADVQAVAVEIIEVQLSIGGLSKTNTVLVVLKPILYLMSTSCPIIETWCLIKASMWLWTL